jgi:predicted Zn finger-like uncharacterized protein
MKINCPKCSRPFQVAEDNLTEEGIRIRCSSCGSVIRLKGKKKAPPQVAPGGPKPDAWFAVIGGERVGPFGPKALAELVAKGKLNNDSLLWKKGLPAWAKAATVPELAGLFVPEPLAPPPAFVPAPPPVPTPTAISGPKPTAGAVDEYLSDESTEDTGEVLFFPGDEEARPARPGANNDDSGSWHKAPPPAKALTEDSTEAFFKAHSDHHEPLPAYTDEIELGEPSVEPVSLEDETHKGARETLRDFSVMAKLSSRSRRRHVFIASGLGLLCVAALAVVTIFGDKIEFTGKQRELEWEGAKDFYGKPRASRPVDDLPQAPTEEGPAPTSADDKIEVLPDLDQDLSIELAVGDVDGISKEQLKRRFRETAADRSDKEGPVRPRVRGGDEWGSGGAGTRDEEEKVGDLLDKQEARREIVPEAAPVPKAKTPRNGSAEVAPSSDFLSRGGIVEERVAAEIKERKSDGTLWQTAVRNNIIRKINAERKRLQVCADSAGASSGVRIILSLSQEGQITDINPAEGGAQFRACLDPILKGWKAGRRIPKAVKLPVKLHFE